MVGVPSTPEEIAHWIIMFSLNNHYSLLKSKFFDYIRAQDQHDMVAKDRAVRISRDIECNRADVMEIRSWLIDNKDLAKKWYDGFKKGEEFLLRIRGEIRGERV